MAILTTAQVVPDDNSCLFSAVALVFEQTIEKASEMRTSTLLVTFWLSSSSIQPVVAEGIRKDPTTYNEAILGCGKCHTNPGVEQVLIPIPLGQDATIPVYCEDT